MASRTRYRIGRHFFLEMDRAPLLSSLKVTYAVASNTDGASIFLDGNRGELFQIRTLVDASGESDVQRLMRDYYNTTGAIHRVRHDWQDYGDYLVDHVLPNSDAILKVIGGVRRAQPTHFIDCVWTLYPIRNRNVVVES